MRHANCVVLVMEQTDSLIPLQDKLKQYGANTTILSHPASVTQACIESAADLLVLPVESGYLPLLVSRLRHEHPALGILALSNEVNPNQRVQLLLTGADACLLPDVEVPEILACTHAVRRRLATVQTVFEHKEAPAVVQSPAVSDKAVPSTTAWRLLDKGWSLQAPNGQVLELTHSERQLMDAFTRTPDARISREDLMRDKGMSMADSRAVDSLISRLRRKASRANLNLPVKSVHGWGYTFAGPLIQSSQEPESEVSDTTAESLPENSILSAQQLQPLVAQLVQQPELWRESFGFSYQTRVAVSNGLMSGVDAQARWRLADGLAYANDSVLGCIEDIALSRQIQAWVLHALLSDMRGWWQEYGLRARRVALKVTPAFLTQVHQELPAMLRQYGVEIADLELDLDMSRQAQPDESLMAVLRNLHGAGFSVYLSIEDLVSEQLSALRHLPIKGVKLGARVLKRAAIESSYRLNLELALQHMHEWGLRTVLKGVDSLELRELALNMELSDYQGLITSDPMSKDAFLLTLACTETN